MPLILRGYNTNYMTGILLVVSQASSSRLLLDIKSLYANQWQPIGTLGNNLLRNNAFGYMDRLARYVDLCFHSTISVSSVNSIA